jgi:hypothetical protein
MATESGKRGRQRITECQFRRYARSLVNHRASNETGATSYGTPSRLPDAAAAEDSEDGRTSIDRNSGCNTGAHAWHDS